MGNQGCGLHSADFDLGWGSESSVPFVTSESYPAASTQNLGRFPVLHVVGPSEQFTLCSSPVRAPVVQNKSWLELLLGQSDADSAIAIACLITPNFEASSTNDEEDR